MNRKQLFEDLANWLNREFATVTIGKEWFKISDLYHVVTGEGEGNYNAYLVKIEGGKLKQIAAFNAQFVDLPMIVNTFIKLSK